MTIKRKCSTVSEVALKKARNQSIASLATQKLRETYADMDDTETDVILDPKSGMTLRQTLERDIGLWLKDTGMVTFTPLYHQANRKIFRNTFDLHAQLKPPEGFDVRPKLFKAMIAVKKKASSRSQILNFLCTTDMLNPAEFSGVARWFITLKTSCAKVQLPCAAKVLAHVARLDCATIHPDHFKLIQPFIERIILALWSRVHKSQSKEQFISNNFKMICLCVPEKSLKEVYQLKPELYASKAADLTEVVTSGLVGRTLFDHALSTVITNQINGIIKSDIQTLLTPARKSKKVVTAEDFMSEKLNTLKKCTDLDGVEGLAEKRTIDVWYGSVVLKSIQVYSVVEQVDISYWAAVKALAVKLSTLETLCIESILCGDPKHCTFTHELSPELLAKPKLLRNRINAMLGSESSCNSNTVQQVINKESHNLKLIDESAAVEIAMLNQLTGDQSSQHSIQSILSAMPSAEVEVEPEVVIQRLDLIKATKQHKMSPPTVQRQMTHVYNLIMALVDERTPQIKPALANPVLKPIIDRMDFFVRDKGAGNKPLFGQDAMRSLYEKAQVRVAASSCTHDDLKHLKLYKWLRPDDIANNIIQLIAQVRKDSQSLSKALSKTPTASSASSSSKGNAKKSDTAVEAALSMFK